MKISRFCLFFTLFFLTFSFKIRAEQEVIDLGDLEVVGEIRRPNLFLVESSKSLDQLVRKSAQEKWNRFEEDLTQPRSLQEIQTLVEASGVKNQ